MKKTELKELKKQNTLITGMYDDAMIKTTLFTSTY